MVAVRLHDGPQIFEESAVADREVTPLYLGLALLLVPAFLQFHGALGRVVRSALGLLGPVVLDPG